MLKLSIIIPVYNVEQYVGKCLESCLNQDLLKEEFEIIVVNDGTKDNSVHVVEKYINEKNNIRIVHRENGGLSAARNTGLKEAKGEYVWFVDSDDWIQSNVIASLFDLAKKNQLDVLCFCLQLVFENGMHRKYNIPYDQDEYVRSGKEFICKINMPPAAWSAFYRRDFLLKNNLFFKEGILHEDQEFTPRAYYLAERIAYTDRVIYNYYQRSGGIMRSNQSEKRCKDLLLVADSLYSFLKEHKIDETETYFAFINKVNFAFSQSLVYYSKVYFDVVEYKNRAYYPLKGDLNWKYRLINFSLPIYLFVYKLMKA